MAFINPLPVLSSAPLSVSRCTVRPAFVSTRVAPSRPHVSAPRAPRMEFEISDGVQFDLNPIVVVLAMVGWIVPSSIPTGIPLTEGTGLSQAFFNSMNENLANWPKGPALEDPFWLLLTIWHVGMFATLIFGTIGYNISKANK